MKAFNISNSCFDQSDKYKPFKKTTSSSKRFPEHYYNNISQTLLYETSRTSKMNQSITSSISNNPTKAGSTLPIPKHQSITSLNIYRYNPKMSLPSITKSMSRTQREPTIITLKYSGRNNNNTSLYAFRNIRNIKKVAVAPHQIKECIQTKEMPEDLYGEKIVDMIYSNINSSNSNNVMDSKSERVNKRFNSGDIVMNWCLFEHVIGNVIEHCVEYRSKNNNVISRNVIKEFYEEEIQKVKNELHFNNTLSYVDDDNDKERSDYNCKYKCTNTKENDNISSINERPSELETSYDKIMLKTLNVVNAKITMNDIEYIKHKVKTQQRGVYNNIIIPQWNNSNSNNDQDKDKHSLLHEILFHNGGTADISKIITSIMTRHNTHNPRKLKQFRFTHNKALIPHSERHTVWSRNDNDDNGNGDTKVNAHQERSSITKRDIQVQQVTRNRNTVEHSVSQDNNITTNFKEFQKSSGKIIKNNSRNHLSQFRINNNNHNSNNSVFGVSNQNEVSTKEETSITNNAKQPYKPIAMTIEENMNNSKERNEYSVIRKDNNSSMQIHRRTTHKRLSTQIRRNTTHKRTLTQNDITKIQQPHNNNGNPCSSGQAQYNDIINIQHEPEQEKEESIISFSANIKVSPSNINSKTNKVNNEHKNTPIHSGKSKQKPQSKTKIKQQIKPQQKSKLKPKLKPLQLRHYKTSYFPYLKKNLFLKQNTYQSFLFSRIALSHLNKHRRSNTAKPPHKHQSKYKRLRLGLLNSTTFNNDYLIYSPSQSSSSSSINASSLSSLLSDQHSNTNSYNKANSLFKPSNSPNEPHHRMQIKFIPTQQRKPSQSFFNMKPKSRFVNYRKRAYGSRTSMSSSSAIALNKHSHRRNYNNNNDDVQEEGEEVSKNKTENVSQLQKFIEMIKKAKTQGEDCYIKELTDYLDNQFEKTDIYTTKLHEDRINKFKFDLTHKLRVNQEVSQELSKGIQFKDTTTFYTKHLPHFKSTS